LLSPDRSAARPNRDSVNLIFDLTDQDRFSSAVAEVLTETERRLSFKASDTIEGFVRQYTHRRLRSERTV